MPDENKKQAVSPINGQPIPKNGHHFTSENAREYAAKGNETKRRLKAERDARASIAQSFIAMMRDERFGEDGKKTGAEIMASAIMDGASKGNAKMVEIALGLLGENPALKMEHIINTIDDETRNRVKELIDGHSVKSD